VTIPHTVHHIWADTPRGEGPEPVPSWVTRQMAHWDNSWLPDGWAHEVWTTERVMADPDLAQIADTAAALHLPHRGLSDLLRWKILQRDGGLYLDIDVLPLTRDLAALLDCPTICTSGPRSKRTLDQWGLALAPNDPLTRGVQTYAAQALMRGVRNEHAVAGPQATRRVWDAMLSVDRDRYRIYWDCAYAESAAVTLAMASADLSTLRTRYPTIPLLPTSGGRAA
jgi:hypothetical protein